METLWLGAGVFAHPCIKKKKKNTAIHEVNKTKC